MLESKIKCIIETPQFRPDGTIKEFYRQTGFLSFSDFIFYPDSCFGHKVWFNSLRDFLKAVIKYD